MDKKALFNEALSDFVAYAAACGNKTTKEEVKKHFGDLIEDDSQYSFIYDYLTVNKITVEGIEAPVNSIFQNTESSDSDSIFADGVTESDVESEEELAFIKMYMSDLEAIPEYSDDEKKNMIEQLLIGNMDVVEALINTQLNKVASIAESYRGRGVHFGDLIQEGNMGVMLAISDFDDSYEKFDSFVEQRIVEAIEATLNSQINSDRIGQHLADNLNRLDNTTKALSEKLGRVPELDELASAMNMSKEEVGTLLKTSLDTLSVNDDTQITDDTTNSDDGIYDVGTSSDEPYDFKSTGDPLSWRVNKK